jgi:hypothetical protein
MVSFPAATDALLARVDGASRKGGGERPPQFGVPRWVDMGEEFPAVAKHLGRTEVAELCELGEISGSSVAVRQGQRLRRRCSR